MSKLKTAQQATDIADVIEKETDTLPDTNFFGDSNRSQIVESRTWILALRRYALDGTIPTDDNRMEVSDWITGEGWSALSDYEA